VNLAPELHQNIISPQLLERDDENVAGAAEDEGEECRNGRVEEHRDRPVPDHSNQKVHRKTGISNTRSAS
jgi:hypothetical protein